MIGVLAVAAWMMIGLMAAARPRGSTAAYAPAYTSYYAPAYTSYYAPAYTCVSLYGPAYTSYYAPLRRNLLLARDQWLLDDLSGTYLSLAGDQRLLDMHNRRDLITRR